MIFDPSLKLMQYFSSSVFDSIICSHAAVLIEIPRTNLSVARSIRAILNRPNVTFKWCQRASCLSSASAWAAAVIIWVFEANAEECVGKRTRQNWGSRNSSKKGKNVLVWMGLCVFKCECVCVCACYMGVSERERERERVRADKRNGLSRLAAIKR